MSERLIAIGDIHGRNAKAYVTKTGDICIDSGCVFGGNLCALVIEEDGNSKFYYEPRSKKDALK